MATPPWPFTQFRIAPSPTGSLPCQALPCRSPFSVSVPPQSSKRKQAAHRERQGGRRESAPSVAAETPIVDIVGKCRRNIRRRMKQRNDRAALGIASDRFPRDEIVAEHDKQTDAAENPGPVVIKSVPQQLRLARRVDRVGRKLGNNRQTFAWREPPRGRDHQSAGRVGSRPPVAPTRAQPTCISGPAERPRSTGKLKIVVHRQNRKIPEVPGDVPVEFGPAVEPADLSSRPVAKDIRVLAARDVDILAAGVDTNDAVLARGGIFLRPAVALDAQQLEVHLTHLSARIFEGQRKITVDAVPDLAPFRLRPVWPR